jgi:tetratricopeptide (TPR) repeat protein
MLDVKTDSNGHFRFEAIPGGTYELHAKMPGYHELSKRDVVHAENEKTSVDFLLEKDSAPQTEKPAAQPMEYSDRPEFTVAGLTDPTNLGGHGSDVMVRTKEELAKETASLNRGASESMKPGSPTSNSTEQNVRALLAQEDRAELHESLGDIEEGEGHPLEAVREYERAAEMQPSEGYLFAWGAELLLHRAPEPAGEVFARGHRLFPRSVRMLQGLGVASYDRGSYELAVRQLLKACDMDPANPNSYSFLFKIQNAEKVEIPGWTERLRRLVDLQPENAFAYYYYAVGLANDSKQTANREQVEPLLLKAIQLDARLGDAYLQLGILYSGQKDFSKAITAYQKAIECTRLPAEAHFRLAQAYRQTGEKLKARQEIELYEQISKRKTEEDDRDLHEIPEFVYTMKGQPASSQAPASVPH